MTDIHGKGLSAKELELQHAVELPDRNLLLSVDLLGIPIIGVTGLNISIS